MEEPRAVSDSATGEAVETARVPEAVAGPEAVGAPAPPDVKDIS